MSSSSEILEFIGLVMRKKKSCLVWGDHSGPVVIIFATGPEVREGKPGRGRWIFSESKTLIMTSFGSKVKPWFRVVDLRHVKEPQVEIRTSEQNLSDFSRSL